MPRVGHKSAVTVIVCLDETRCAFVSGDECGTVCLWDGPDQSAQAPSRTCKVASDAITAACKDAVDAHVLYVAHGTRISVLDVAPTSSALSILRVFTFNSDDVNALSAAVAPHGSTATAMLASADDDGCIALVDTSKVRTSGLRLIRTLRKGHSNICSTVSFAPAPAHTTAASHLVSGGFDCAVAVWSTTSLLCQQHSTGALFAHVRHTCQRRALFSPLPLHPAAPHTLSLSLLGPLLPVEYPPTPTGTGRGASSRGGGGSSTPTCPRVGFDTETLTALSMAAGSGQMLNPPFVHACVWAPPPSRHSDTDAEDPPAYCVTAHGDGLVVVWAWDPCPDNGVGYHLTPAWWAAPHATAATCLAFLPLPEPGTWALACTGNDRVLCLWLWADILAQIDSKAAYPSPSLSLQASGAPPATTLEEAIAATFVASHAAGKGTARAVTAPRARIKLRHGVNALAGVRTAGVSRGGGQGRGQGQAQALLLVGDTAPGLGVHDLGRLLGLGQAAGREERASDLAPLLPALTSCVPSSLLSPALSTLPCLAGVQGMDSLLCTQGEEAAGPSPEEHVTVLYPTDTCTGGPTLRIERIVSHGHASPEGYWYDQGQGEWVAVLQGEGVLHVQADRDTLRTNGSLSPCAVVYPDCPAGPEGGVVQVSLMRGQWLDLPAHCKHRVVGTTAGPGQGTVWLAVFY